MGLKHASVRHPNVVVMAPALTEAGQSHNFKLPTTISSPVSPISIAVNSNGKRIDSQNCPFLNLDTLKESRSKVGMNGNSLNIKPTIFAINGTDEISNEHVSPSKQSDLTFQNQKELNENNTESKVNKVESDASKWKINSNTSGLSTEASEYSLLQIGGFMMNNSYLSMGDHDDNMGLQKSSAESSTLDSSNYLKMDQLFKNLGSTISNSDLGGSGDFGGQNVEDILQVIKSMESQPNDIDEQLDSGQNADSEGIFHMGDSADIAGSLSTFERDLFNDVDMMNMCDENLADSSLVMVNKGTLINEKVDDVQKRQFQLERKCEWLVRRLRKLQARSMGKQASEEVTGLLEHVNNVLSESSVNSSKPLTLLSALTSNKESDCDKKSKAMSSAAFITLMRRLDQSSQQQAVATTRPHVPCKYFGSGSSDNATVVSLNNGLRSTPLPGSILPKLSVGIQQEVQQVSGQLYTHLKTVESGIDSDVTASSSGAESCDEMQTFNNPHQQQLTISKRAAWRWAEDRASVASRWVWLQAQISDLEYRIRQQTEVNRQVRTAKGGLVLGGDDPPRLSESVVVNGYHGSLPGSSAKSVDDVECDSVSRTRPLVRSSFRKRKLLQTQGLHLVSKKALRAATLRCGCRPPLPTCALCTGRQDPTQPREQLSLLTVNERIGLLDPGFHPVLSFPCDVSMSVHFDALMKTMEWQQKAQRHYMKSQQPVIRTLESLGDEVQERRTKKPLVEHHRKKYNSGLKKTTANALSEKIKKKLAKGKKTKVRRDPNNPNLDRFKTRRRFSLKVPGHHDGDNYLEIPSKFEDENSSASATPYILVGGVTHPSPAPSPSSTPLTLLSANKGDLQRRKRENSYDIDNIVIPYSVAASTRVEKLQYKEILTPKWRVVSEEPIKLETKNNGVVRRSSQESDAEDISEENVVLRHERCEQEERKKFSTYLKLPNSMARSRGNRRADSRAESSGANTPDPMSPVAQDHTYGGSGSPMTSPPATPLPADIDSTSVIIRRRTVSLSRIRDREEPRCTTPTDNIHDEVAPYELRTFPLPDEIYERMQKAMPPGYPFKTHANIRQLYSKDSECESRPQSPASDSTESADSYIDEDPNDPEWTASFTSFDRSKR